MLTVASGVRLVPGAVALPDGLALGVVVAVALAVGLGGHPSVEVPFAHPRSYKLKTTTEFAAIKERLTEEIRAETVRAAEQGL